MTPKKNNAIWVIVDRFTKSTHFLPVWKDFSMNKFFEIYIVGIVRLHGLPVSIISDRDPRFTSHFWETLQSALGTQLRISTSYHPQTDGQSERTIQTLEDMLRAYILEEGGDWSKCLPLAEFAYNNSYHTSIGMAPYETLYGRRCRTPVCWVETGEKLLLGPELVQETTNRIKLLKEKLKTAQDRQKSYADRRRKPLEFQVGDHVFLKATPYTTVGKATKVKKLQPRYVGPFQILKRIGPVAYQLALPPNLSNLHSVFHVSQLRKYVADSSHTLTADEVELEPNLTHRAQPVMIIDRGVKRLRNKSVPLVKVLWKSLASSELTWKKSQT